MRILASLHAAYDNLKVYKKSESSPVLTRTKPIDFRVICVLGAYYGFINYQIWLITCYISLPWYMLNKNQVFRSRVGPVGEWPTYIYMPIYIYTQHPVYLYIHIYCAFAYVATYIYIYNPLCTYIGLCSIVYEFLQHSMWYPYVMPPLPINRVAKCTSAIHITMNSYISCLVLCIMEFCLVAVHSAVPVCWLLIFWLLVVACILCVMCLRHSTGAPLRFKILYLSAYYGA